MVKLRDICQVPDQINDIERLVMRFGMPVLILVMTIFLADERSLIGLLISFAEALIGISLAWYVSRIIIFEINKRMKFVSYIRKMLLQLSATFFVSSLLVIGLFVVHKLIFRSSITTPAAMLFLKNLIVTLFLITLMVNVVYELFFLFDRFIAESLEKEDYKKAVVESKLEVLRNQVNPHFLFNTFNALSEIIEENPKRASNAILELSDVYRYVLNARESNWASIEKELAITRSFIEVLKIRYEENVAVTIDIEPKYKDWYLPPLSLQMLIENAIKHNEISTSKKLNISIYNRGEQLLVRNNRQPKVITKGSNGIGLKNIQKRYSFLLNKNLEVIKLEKEFIVILPLVKAIEQ